MSHIRFSKILLVVLALVLWVGTASAGTQNYLASPSPVNLYYVAGGGNSQTIASVPVTLTENSSGSPSDTVAVSQSAWPTWLTKITGPFTPTYDADTPVSPVLTFVGDGSALAPAAAPYTYVVHLTEAADPDVLITVNLYVITTPLAPAQPGLGFTYQGGAASTQPAVGINSIAQVTSAAFIVDPATLPLWLTVDVSSGTATPAAGTPLTFSIVTQVAAALPPGTQTAQVGFVVTGFTGEYYLPVTLLVSNALPTLSLKEGATGKTISSAWSAGMAIPIPVVTPTSTNEPIPFTAACTITAPGGGSTANCNQSMNLTSGLAYTWGTAVSISALDTALFNGVQLGNTVTVQFTITPTQGSNANTPIVVSYQYTLVPVAATIKSATPSSVAPIPVNTSVTVLLTGAGFVGPGSIKTGSGLAPTKVWLGTAPATSYVVLSNALLQVTIPHNSFPAIPAGSTSTTLQIGVANQTGTSAPSAPAVSYNLTITNGPVIYGLTNTATYIQPTPGNSPNVAAYELISIFGNNFGPPAAGLSGAPDKYGKVPTALTINATTSLKVTFTQQSGKTTVNYAAPILFANPSQINCAVPAGMTAGTPATMTVTSGAFTTDVFNVNVVAADPGIFTMASDGVGQGAILVYPIASPGTVNVNSAENVPLEGDTISIYMTGLGAPDSTAADATSNKSTLYPSACVAVSNTSKTSPGYLQVVNTAGTGYTSPAWTNIDGAIISYSAHTLLGGLPPCNLSPVTVTIGTGASALVLSSDSIAYAGFVSGAVAGLYQVNVTLPTPLNDGANNPLAGTSAPIQVTIGASSSPALTATIQF